MLKKYREKHYKMAEKRRLAKRIQENKNSSKLLKKERHTVLQYFVFNSQWSPGNKYVF
jgi:hypothetical protein